ncbi:MAG: killer suppression protein [Armatimonadota bacterium]|nr:killer suppression protein [Armatimonadota bacterium]
MDIIFRTSKLEKLCNNKSYRERECGPVRAKLLGRRMDDLRASTCLADIARLPQTRCHELVKDRDGQISLDLDHPYRLIFTVANEPVPVKPDGGLDWSRVTAIKIMGVEDTHG